jgi:hypothetical protein
MTLLQICTATAAELHTFLGYVPEVSYDYQVRELARQKFYSDKGLSVPANDGPTYDA